MSVVYESRYMHDSNGSVIYPALDDHHDPTPDAERFTDPSDSVVNSLATIATFNAPPPFGDTSETHLNLGAPSPAKEDSPTASTPQRIKAIPKPDREITKNAEGKYVCSWQGCTEDVREFGRKCEWNKHMDKHDRPYKCAVEGCEKLPGFTYSGGLLRHEREVHGKHGGPKNSFNCPHPNCKRHTGKGFSRLENLNEHLRRVHTPNNGALPTCNEGETDEAASDVAVGVIAAAANKRKRDTVEEVGGGGDAREEIKRLLLENTRIKQENTELRQQVDGLTRQTVTMMQRITNLQAQTTRTAPAAPMATGTVAPESLIG
ncbi:hypothetical protein B0T22DRAFT_481772 [Podospora appendiculata]|uniref:C2H2-type domain-containing protein n=1 Tax=Podospora appendiculata TaxID=314037 RepID=A0AAE1C9R8_9PEZI|nr:hypothetical protein B0T22DRAFT_481772 [Podospora appendiculata]